jgi:hypothetical protein
LIEKVAAPVYKTENTAVGIRHADQVALSISKKLAITSPTSGGRSVGIVTTDALAARIPLSEPSRSILVPTQPHIQGVL